MTQVTIGIAKTRSRMQYNDPMRGRVRLKIIGTRQYLHLTGKGQTTGTDYAWIGTPAQARKLRERAEIRGEAWPYSMVRAKVVVPVIDEVAA